MKVLMMKLKKRKEIEIEIEIEIFRFYCEKDSININIGFYIIVPTIKESTMILHKAHLSIQRHLIGKSLAYYIFKPFSTIGQICITMLMSIQEIV